MKERSAAGGRAISGSQMAAPHTGRLIGAALGLGLLAAIASLGLFTWLADEVVEGDTQAIDDWLLLGLHDFATPWLTDLMRIASVWGAPSRLAIFGAAAAAYFLVRGWRRGTVLIGVTLAGGALLDTVLKQTFGRARPTPFFDHYPAPETFSFPSGHALFSVCFFGGVAALLAARIRRPAFRVAVWLLAGAVIVLIGLSRVYLGVHYPSDVIAGYSAGTIWVAAVALADRVAERRRTRRGLRSEPGASMFNPPTD
ncbi:MAG: phosphatase PAP2 family protein [Gemmatimonadales bacterium]|nr:phosphatase PAP2 family protein [Gemmatimonadales bacterium]